MSNCCNWDLAFLNNTTFVGLDVGGTVGNFVGLDVGGTVGNFVGLDVGGTVGNFVGLDVGGTVGNFVGLDVGGTVGNFVGLDVGGFVGLRVGLAVLGFDVTGLREGLFVGDEVTTPQVPILSCSGKKGHHNEVSGSLARSQSSAYTCSAWRGW